MIEILCLCRSKLSVVIREKLSVTLDYDLIVKKVDCTENNFFLYLAITFMFDFTNKTNNFNGKILSLCHLFLVLSCLSFLLQLKISDNTIQSLTFVVM